MAKLKPEFELAKKLKGPAKSQMQRVRAARAMIEAQRNGKSAEEMALYGFMAVFHPEYSDDQVRTLIRARR